MAPPAHKLSWEAARRDNNAKTGTNVFSGVEDDKDFLESNWCQDMSPSGSKTLIKTNDRGRRTKMARMAWLIHICMGE